MEHAALVALLRRGDRSWPELTDQVEAIGSAYEVLTAVLDSSGQSALFDTGPAVDLDAIADEITAWESDGMRFVTVLDEEYPFHLRLVHQRPPFLFLRGHRREDDRRVAVVGTRHPSPGGVAHAHAIATGLALRGGRPWSAAWQQASTRQPTARPSWLAAGPLPSSEPACATPIPRRTPASRQRSPNAAS